VDSDWLPDLFTMEIYNYTQITITSY
jgi:hypothetical protein